jgi:hypothetical protein
MEVAQARQTLFRAGNMFRPYLDSAFVKECVDITTYNQLITEQSEEFANLITLHGEDNGEETLLTTFREILPRMASVYRILKRNDPTEEEYPLYRYVQGTHHTPLHYSVAQILIMVSKAYLIPSKLQNRKGTLYSEVVFVDDIIEVVFNFDR